MTAEAEEIFTGGKTTNPPKFSGRDIANRFLKHRAASVREEVAGDVVLMEGISILQEDQAKLAELAQELVRAKVLSEEEARLGLESKSHLSMLRTIGKYAHVILDERILPFVQPGYSVLYQLVLLYRD